ncbi:MAG: ATP-binding protein [Candidatus Thermoplasmatota archaeon]|jgi:hypothetical protein|nr:ATP-binding protein [Candidatus Thermoplasmatota archaeon]
MDIKEVLTDQRKDLLDMGSRERLIDREHLDDARNMLDHPNILVVTGVRRCGKSIFSYLIAKGENFGYVNFDDERFLGMKTDDLNNVLRSLYELHGDINYIILDEVQNIVGWELFTSRLRQSKRVIVTGSNSKMLSGELASRLTGRYMEVSLFPLSFREFLDLNGSLPPDDMGTLDRAKVQNVLRNYISIGGFPEVHKFGPAILRTIYDNIVTKDIVMRYGIRKSEALRQLAKYLISNHSEEFTYNKLSKVLDVKRNDTIATWVRYLEDAFLIFHLERFDFKLKQQFKSPKKAYCIDTGLIHKVGFSPGPNIGRLMENVVAVELMRRNIAEGGSELYYWKDHSQNEVDFVVRKNGHVVRLIQVTYASDIEGVRDRELKALSSASIRLDCNEAQVITWDLDDKRCSNGLNIQFIPLWKWLLKR